MRKLIPINLVVEDSISDTVLRKLLVYSRRQYFIGGVYGFRGSGYLRKTINGFNEAAKGTPFFVLTDLDKYECAPVLIRQWISSQRHANLIFRVAVHEVEAWLLAHREAFAKFLGINESLIPLGAETVPDPKECVVELARQSKYRELRDAIVPRSGSTAKIGPDYNGKMCFFVKKHWDFKIAMKRSDSLNKAVNTINTFKPTLKESEDFDDLKNNN